MTELERWKLPPRSLVFFFVLVALDSTTFASTAPAGRPTADDRLTVGSVQTAVGESPIKSVGARHVPVKSEHTAIKKGFSKRDIQLKFVEGSGIEHQGQAFVSKSVDVAALNALLSFVPELQVASIFTGLPRQLRHEKSRLETQSGRDLPDLSLYFHVTLGSGATVKSAERLIDALNAFPIVEFAEPVPMPALPPSHGFSKYAAHEFALPDGIGTTQVTGVAGVLGDYVQIVDIENKWNVNHEDLTAATRPEAFTRIVPNARVRTVNADSTSIEEGQGVANAIYVASLNVGAGDVILLEQQTPGPNYPCSTDDQCGLVPIEYDDVVYAAITWATAYGIIVIEAAGNGHQNLDATEYDDTFNTLTGRPDSGAIIVGAGAAPASCKERAGKPIHSRLEFSNYGEFVDLQGSGECSRASHIVAGAAAAYSSATEATIGTYPTSWHVRHALMSTGTTQDTTSQNALQGNIGPLPNLLAALALIGTDTTPPTITAPIQSIVKGKVGSTVPIRVRWSASDASGIKSYKLWRSTNGGNLVLDATLSPTATSHTYLLPVGNSYLFRVVAYDNAGNASAPARGPTFTPTVTDDSSCCIYSVLPPGSNSSWIHESSSEAYLGTLSKFEALSFGTRGIGGRAKYTFTGRDVAYVAALGDWRSVSVRIDDVIFPLVQLYRGTAVGARIVISRHWASSGTHTIEISSLSQGWINVDAFVVNQ
jgi:serine protease